MKIIKPSFLVCDRDEQRGGLRIIEEAYAPVASKTYVKAEIKGENGEWKNIPLGMTES